MSQTKTALYQWQKEAAIEFARRGHKMTIEAATGAGKSRAAINMMHQYLEHYCVMIVVPTIPIMNMWYDTLRNEFINTNTSITKYYGVSKQFGKITIAVRNSLIKMRAIPEQYQFIVFDEVHNYASPRSIKLLRNNSERHLLGLSATLTRSDGLHQKIEKIVPVGLRMTQEDARAENLICPFEVNLVGCELSLEKRDEYKFLNNRIRRGLQQFNFDHVKAQQALKFYGSQKQKVAVQYMKDIATRKDMLANLFEKRLKALELVKNHEKDQIIIFNERIDMCEDLKEMFDRHQIQSGIYHSKIKKKERDKMLDAFASGKLNVLLTVKALDEGVNVVGANIAIILSGNSTKRQIIQRVGRVLRKKEGKVAKLYYVYAIDTKDKDYVLKNIKHLKNSAENISWS